MHLESVRRARASSLEGSLQGCTVGMGYKHPPADEHTDLLEGTFDRLEEEGSSCRPDMQLEVDRSRQCRVAEACNRGHTRQGCTARCTHHLDL
jgi:hypothetical protein